MAESNPLRPPKAGSFSCSTPVPYSSTAGYFCYSTENGFYCSQLLLLPTTAKALINCHLRRSPSPIHPPPSPSPILLHPTPSLTHRELSSSRPSHSTLHIIYLLHHILRPSTLPIACLGPPSDFLLVVSRSNPVTQDSPTFHPPPASLVPNSPATSTFTACVSTDDIPLPPLRAALCATRIT